MLVVSELRNGTFFEQDGVLFQVLSYEHIKLGRGSATIKVKVKNVRSGSMTEKSFINGAKVRDVSVIKKEMQYLYKDEEFAYFMETITFEQMSISLKLIDGYEFLREGGKYIISIYEDEALSVSIPPKVDLKIIETPPEAKGNSSSNVFKEAKLENDIVVKVPMFINEGDMVRIDTRTKAYTERV